MEPAPDTWTAIPGMEIRLENHQGFGPKDYGLFVDVENQDGEVSYRVMIDGQPLDQEHHQPPGQGHFVRTKNEQGPQFPDRRVTMEWKRQSPDGGLSAHGKIRFGLMDCCWGLPQS